MDLLAVKLLCFAILLPAAWASRPLGKREVEQCPEPLCDCRNLGDGIVEIHCVNLNMTGWPVRFLPRTRALYFGHNLLTTLLIAGVARYLSIQDIHASHNQILSLANNDLQSLPNLRFLDLRYNGLTFIGDTAFRFSPRLTTLLLSNNAVQGLTRWTFHGLTQLLTLDLSNQTGSLRIEQHSFAGPTNLATLSLAGAGLQEIPTTDFRTNLARLQTLNLANNSITAIPDNVFFRLTVLVSLDLSRNFLVTFTQKSLHSLGNLRTLNLAYNPLNELSYDNFRYTPRMVNLDMQFSSITEIRSFAFVPTSFVPLHNFESLRLRGNLLRVVRANAFYRVQVRTLDASYNQLEAIEGNQGSFNYIVNLDFSHNRVSRISDRAFYSNAVTIDVSHNLISSIGYQVLAGRSIRTVDLSYNNISSIHRNAFYSPVTLSNPRRVVDYNGNFQTLNFSYQSGAWDLEAGTFRLLYTLQTLDMRSAGLTNYSNSPFVGLSGLEDLDIRDNRAVNLPNLNGLDILQTLRFNFLPPHHTLPQDFFFPISNVTALYLSNGALRRLDEEVFNNVTDLQTLDLSSNELDHFNSTAFGRNLTDLRYINLSNNSKLSSIPVSVLGLVPSLTTLLMSSCSVSVIPSRALAAVPGVDTLDLSFNRIATVDEEAFLGATNLTNLYLNNNFIHTINPFTFRGQLFLRQVHLQHNQLTGIPAGLFATGVATLQQLRLDHNSITNLLEEIGNITASALHLYNNTWECTCGIFWLHNLVNRDALPMEDSIRCHGPSNYTNQQIGMVPETFVFCVPPSIVSITPSQRILEGQSFQLTCNAFGYPVPEVRWYRDGQRLALVVFNESDPATRMRLSQSTNGSLLFRVVEGSDEALYTCLAVSVVHTTSANVFLTVIDDCRSSSCFVMGMTLRYFHSSHPDFSRQSQSLLSGTVRNVLMPSSGFPTLDTSRSPSVVGPGNNIASMESFSQWFKTTDGVNSEAFAQLRFDRSGGGSTSYQFTDRDFFPTDRFNASGTTCSGIFHQTQYTAVVRGVLPRTGLQSVVLRTDLTAWLFIDQQLAVDLGGVHSESGVTLDLSSTAVTGTATVRVNGSTLTTSVPMIFKHNSSVRFELFLAHRQDCQSTLTLQVTYQQQQGSPLSFYAGTQVTRYLERSAVNTELLRVTAPSLDYSLHLASAFNFSLVEVDPNTSSGRRFTISAISGTVVLVNSLDYEVTESYILAVNVAGLLPDGSRVVSRVAVIVSVRNELDSGLYFSQSSYSVLGVTGGQHRRDGSHLLSLILIDDDKGRDTATIAYNTSQPSPSHYILQGKSYTVVVTVVAIDNGVPPRVAQTNITIEGLGVCRPSQFSVLSSSATLRQSTLVMSTATYFVTESGTCETCTAGFYCPGDGMRYLCGCEDLSITVHPVVRFRHAVTTIPGCVPRTTHSFGVAAQCSPCPIGWICSHGIATPCGLHTAGLQEGVTYADPCSSTYCSPTCLPCPNGHACINGQKVACGPGLFSRQFVECAACPTNSYSRNISNVGCTCCEAGFESTPGQDSCRQCDVSEYSRGRLAEGSCDACHSCAGTDLCPCQSSKPCGAGVICINTPGMAPFYKCLPCPEGLQGDGVNCTDVDECTTRPCSDLTQCMNTYRGYHCTSCPDGYSGVTSHGIGLSYAMNNKQNCTDIDECAASNGGCDLNSYCNNTQGSFNCGPCVPGFVGNGNEGCSSGDYCALGLHNCDSNASCIMTEAAQFSCQCNFGFAGNGQFCGEDSDLDGFPSVRLNCREANCVQDNCPAVPNSGQANTDGDSHGDACDHDDDQDSWIDALDNCQFVPNINQRDSDGDNIGDACDNCPEVATTDQSDADDNGRGDACSTDSDGDGFMDTVDLCPLVFSANATNNSACSLCPPFRGPTIFTLHPTLLDNDFDDVGTDCPIDLSDTDSDGIPDAFDNCQTVVNPDQANADNSIFGDACDLDDDGDGVLDRVDNCRLVANRAQTDRLGNGIGDACRLDYDGDGVPDALDACPYSGTIATNNFTTLLNISIPVSSRAASTWHVSDMGATITLTTQSSAPIILLAPARLGAVDFSGTLYVDDPEENDLLGFVFSFQSLSRFYLMQWKRTAELFLNQGQLLSKPYWHLLASPSSEEETWTARNSIIDDTTGPPWEPRVAYRWTLQHRPDRGLIRLLVRNASQLVFDSGNVIHTLYRGGRLGLFSFWQADTIWSNLSVVCAEQFDYSLSFDGVDDLVHLPSATSLRLSQSFSVEAWVFPVQKGYDSPLPIMCSPDNQLCLSLSHNGVATARLNSVVVSSNPIPFKQWTHCSMTFNMTSGLLSLAVNFTTVASQEGNETYKGTDRLYLGRDAMVNTFRGQMDEIRFWRVAMGPAGLRVFSSKGNLAGVPGISDLVAQYAFDGERDSIVYDSTDNRLHGLLYGNAQRHASTLESQATGSALPLRKRRGALTDEENIEVDDLESTDHNEL